jgi:hypothetical protein
MSILSGESVRPSRKVVDSSDRAVSPLLSNKSNGSRFVAKLKAMMKSNMPLALLMRLDDDCHAFANSTHICGVAAAPKPHRQVWGICKKQKPRWINLLPGTLARPVQTS